MSTFILIFSLGAIFGLILQYARLNKFEVISGLARLEDFTVAKALALAIGLGLILLSITIGLGWASYHVKPLLLGGIILGGILFGVGMAILGYCPGTLAISLGEGAVDAFWGIIGGLFSAWIFTLLYPSLGSVLGNNLGKFSLVTTFGSGFIFYLVIFLLGGALIYVAFSLHRKEKSSDKKWIYSGIALAVLNVVVFLHGVSNRPIGASTFYPYLADVLVGNTVAEYFVKIHTPGHWELIFLFGAFLAAFVRALIIKDFQIRLTFPSWEKYFGKSKNKRAIWAFVGGFLLIFGARMAGGCTSGHILSGGMQGAYSSYLFGIVVFISLLITGKLFYKK